MSLITMCDYSTIQNNRADILEKCLQSLYETVDWRNHRFILVTNGSTDRKANDISSFFVKRINEKQNGPAERIILPENIGTARGLNLAWKKRKPGEHVIKADSDVVWHCPNWPDRLEEIIRRHERRKDGETWRRHEWREKCKIDPEWANDNPEPPLAHKMKPIGLLGLKRRDLGETMTRRDWGAAEFLEVDHWPGELWLYVERVHRLMGTCVLHTSDLLDEVGYLYQGNRLYGFDDSIMAVRAQAAGFETCFALAHDIEHIDPGDTPYQTWKEEYSGEAQDWVGKQMNGYLDGSIPFWHGPEDE